jgi:hypothetical protein
VQQIIVAPQGESQIELSSPEPINFLSRYQKTRDNILISDVFLQSVGLFLYINSYKTYDKELAPAVPAFGRKPVRISLGTPHKLDETPRIF